MKSVHGVSRHQVPDTRDFYASPELKHDFDTNGYVLVRGLFSSEEITKIRECVESNKDIEKHAFGRRDSLGRMSRLCLWNYAGDDLLGVVARCQKVAGTMQALLGGDELYHYHTKLMMKEAHTGGPFVWHQDYGYWYNNGCMLPEMGSIFMPIDKCSRQNGCLQVLRGSHQLGRIDHQLTGEQAGANPERVEAAKKMFGLVHVEMEPGDVLFFHCNLLHASPNNSENRRYALITAVNKRKNQPIKEHHHPLYHPYKMLPNSAIMECQKYEFPASQWFITPDTDKSAEVLGDEESNEDIQK